MNIIVTGATSFFVSPLIGELQKLGHQIYAVVRPGSKNLGRLPAQKDGLHVIFMEIGELDLLTEVIDQECDLFLHFAWDGAGSDNRMKRELQDENISGSLKALESAAALGCWRFIFSGSQAEYGMYQSLMSEDMPGNPLSEYGRAKAMFGKLAHARCEKWRAENKNCMEYVHARIFSVYGAGDHPWSLVESCLRAFKEGSHIDLGECLQQWNFLYIDDLISAFLALSLNPGRLSEEGSFFNVAGSEKETRLLRKYVEIMYEICGKKGSFQYGQRKPNAEGAVNLIPDIRKIRRITGWEPKTTFENGIRQMIEKEVKQYDEKN